MAGNVYEWVNDWYGSTYYSTSPYANPPGPVTGTSKVLRGGSWNYYVSILRGSVPQLRHSDELQHLRCRLPLCGFPTLMKIFR